MRTTVTLDPDIASLIAKVMKERGISFKEAVNAAIRAGLTEGGPSRARFVQKSFPLGAEQHFRWDKALETAAAIEDEELARKIALRK